ASFPLALRQASQVVSGRVALIGNAAQTMHPVAAQGLNLGLRDAVGL
ncbi:FAD-dependent monooxygenase, partial [Chromobacterium piscinae]